MLKSKLDIPLSEETEHRIRCPITRLVMREPVLATDGNVYEREAIEHWFRHKDISPMTGVRLSDKSVIPQQLICTEIDGILIHHPEFFGMNEVYLPKQKLMECMTAVRKGDIPVLRRLHQWDPRILCTSGIAAIKMSTIFEDQTEATDRSAYQMACENRDPSLNLEKAWQVVDAIATLFHDDPAVLLQARPNTWDPVILNMMLTWNAFGAQAGVCDRLLRLGANIETAAFEKGRDKFWNDGRTPLHWAVVSGAPMPAILETIALLFARGANCNAQNINGWCAAHFAVHSEEQLPILRVLLEQPINLRLRLSGEWCRGAVPLHMAVEKRNINAVKILLEYGLQHGIEVDIKDEAGKTPLFYASAGGYGDIVALLMSYGANIRSRCNDGSFAMGCPGMHLSLTDSWRDSSKQFEEIFGEQVAGATRQCRLLQIQVDELRRANQTLQNKVAELEQSLVLGGREREHHEAAPPASVALLHGFHARCDLSHTEVGARFETEDQTVAELRSSEHATHLARMLSAREALDRGANPLQLAQNQVTDAAMEALLSQETRRGTSNLCMQHK